MAELLPCPLCGPLHDAVKYVVDTFKKDEEQGCHTKDRQFAIEILEKALK